MAKKHNNRRHQRDYELQEKWYTVKIASAEYLEGEDNDDECLLIDCVIQERCDHLRHNWIETKNKLLLIRVCLNPYDYLLKQLYNILDISKEHKLMDLVKLVKGKKVKARVLVSRSEWNEGKYQGIITRFAKIKE